MAQFEPEVPGPLADDLPGLLSPGRVAAPAVRLLFDVFVFQSRFKGPTMQGERHDIGGSEGALGEIGQEQFRDDSIADDSNLALLFFFAGAG